MGGGGGCPKMAVGGVFPPLKDPNLSEKTGDLTKLFFIVNLVLGATTTPVALLIFYGLKVTI